MKYSTFALALALGTAITSVSYAQNDPDLKVEFSVKEQRLRGTLDVDRDGLHNTGDVRLGTNDVSFYWLRNADANLIRDNGKIIGAENTFRLSTRFSKRVANDDALTTDEIRAAIDQNGDLFAGADLSGKLYGTKKGAGAAAGAGVNVPLGQTEGTIAQGSIPLKLDMKIVSIKIVSQGAVTKGGISAGVDTEFDVEWEGNIKIAAGVGGGLNIFRGLKGKIGIEIEIDKAEFKAAMKRAKEATKRFLRNAKKFAIAAKDATVRGARRTKDLATNYRGTGEKSDAPTATPAPGAPVDLSAKSPAEIAARFAPVIAQKLKDGSQNTMLRVNYDGDWNTRNNKDNAGSGDRTPAAYFDVKENSTHYFVTYAFYFASEDHMIKRENDMEGVIVVARKGANAGEEIEMVITTQTDGTQLTRYASKVAKGWESKADAARSGSAKFIDEVGHPHYDAEQTHPQLYVTPRGHNVWAYNGRDDVNPFGKSEGVIYQPGLPASAPSAGATVGYDLLPLSEVTSNATLKDGQRLRGGKIAKNKARLPNAWTTGLEGFEAGSLFNDPAAVLNGWYGQKGAGLAGAVSGN